MTSPTESTSETRSQQIPGSAVENIATRFVKTLVYWPHEELHARDSAAIPWLLVASCLVLGIVVSFVNVFLGIALAIFCLHGNALVRYLITK